MRACVYVCVSEGTPELQDPYALHMMQHALLRLEHWPSLTQTYGSPEKGGGKWCDLAVLKSKEAALAGGKGGRAFSPCRSYPSSFTGLTFLGPALDGCPRTFCTANALLTAKARPCQG